MSVQELPLPDRLDGVEVARVVRTSDDKGVFVIDASLHKLESDPTALWGILIADLTKHVANSLEGRLRAIEDDRVIPREEIFAQLKKVLVAELSENFDSVRRLTDA